MQNAGMTALGLGWRYLAFDVPPEHLRAAIDGAKAMGFLGLNLTVPHKQLALEMMDVVDAEARQWGAVNTVRFEGQLADGSWRPLGQVPDGAAVGRMRSQGFNTDAEGIARSLREDLGFEARGARVLVLGAGGAGRVAALRLARDGARALFLVNRTQSKAEDLAAEIRATTAGAVVAVGYPDGEVDLVVQATSLGLRSEDGLPFDSARLAFSRARAVYDMIYRPAETPFLAAARAAGCRAANGLGMLLYQGARALELWTGRAAPVAEMRRALEEDVYGRAGE